jgi:hypothetical protein
LEKFPNPTWTEIIKLTKDFNIQWAENLKAAISKKHLESLESIIVNRNAIAHGGTSNITLRELSNYYTDIIYIIEKLEDSCV